MSCYNLPCLRLHFGQRHQPRATDVHLKPIFLRGSRHQPRAPNQSMEFQLAKYLDISRNDSASVCDVMVLVCFEKFVFEDTPPSLLWRYTSLVLSPLWSWVDIEFGGVLYVDRVNYVVSLVSLTSLLDRHSEDLGEETTESINPLFPMAAFWQLFFSTEPT